jgi:hypothetical protein
VTGPGLVGAGLLMLGVHGDHNYELERGRGRLLWQLESGVVDASWERRRSPVGGWIEREVRVLVG